MTLYMWYRSLSEWYNVVDEGAMHTHLLVRQGDEAYVQAQLKLVNEHAVEGRSGHASKASDTTLYLSEQGV